jgi:hypothetical protein
MPKLSSIPKDMAGSTVVCSAIELRSAVAWRVKLYSPVVLFVRYKSSNSIPDLVILFYLYESV